jgi:hypothetical protein
MPENVFEVTGFGVAGMNWGAGQNSSVVAQDCLLLYRGFPTRRPLANLASVENPSPSRLEIGDTADFEICATKNFVLHPMI